MMWRIGIALAIMLQLTDPTGAVASELHKVFALLQSNVADSTAVGEIVARLNEAGPTHRWDRATTSVCLSHNGQWCAAREAESLKIWVALVDRDGAVQWQDWALGPGCEGIAVSDSGVVAAVKRLWYGGPQSDREDRIPEIAVTMFTGNGNSGVRSMSGWGHHGRDVGTTYEIRNLGFAPQRNVLLLAGIDIWKDRVISRVCGVLPGMGCAGPWTVELNGVEVVRAECADGTIRLIGADGVVVKTVDYDGADVD